MYLHLKIAYFHPLSFTECSGFVLNFIIALNQGDLGGFFLAALVSIDHTTDNISILGCRILIGFTLEAHVRLLRHLTGPPTRFWKYWAKKVFDVLENDTKANFQETFLAK